METAQLTRADSISLCEFLSLTLGDSTPDHSTLLRNRRLISVETHTEVLIWVLTKLVESGLLGAKTLGVDSTTLEADAALRSIVRCDSGEQYDEFLQRPAKESGIEPPTRADLAKLDRHRKGKGKEWKNPHDPDAKITKRKDGRTRLAHKVEHAVYMVSGAVIAVTIHGGCEGDSQSFEETLDEALENLSAAVAVPQNDAQFSDVAMTEVVAVKGYHSNAVLTSCRGRGIRSYISEPNRGRRNWKGKAEARDACKPNRRSIRGERGKALLRTRGEKLEHGFAHGYESGGMRRLYLRRYDNILKRLVIQFAGLNRGLLMHQPVGAGTPRACQGRLADLFPRISVPGRILKPALALRRLECRPRRHSANPWLHRVSVA